MILINGERYRPDKFYAGEFKTERTLQPSDTIEWNYQSEDLCEDFMLLLLLEQQVRSFYWDVNMEIICDYVPYLRSHHDNDKEFAMADIYGDFSFDFVAKYPQHSDKYVSFEGDLKEYDKTKFYIALDKSEYERCDKSKMSGYFDKERVDGKIVSYFFWDTRPLETALMADDFKGEDIVLVDDLIGYGTTAQKACEILFKQGVNSIAIEVDIAEDIFTQNEYFKENNVEVRYKKLIKGVK